MCLEKTNIYIYIYIYNDTQQKMVTIVSRQHWAIVGETMNALTSHTHNGYKRKCILKPVTI